MATRGRPLRAGPGGPPVVPPSPTEATLRAKLAQMTYSFAQQMPLLPSETPAPPVWPTPAPKPTTAAQIVAAAPPDKHRVAQPDEASARQAAELALYSKLVPTASAVPRNPGRVLGGGRLRATGSVAQKGGRIGPAAALHAPQPVSVIPRKEPTSRMRNLSSEASRPQLERKVARPSRTPSATPPPVLDSLEPGEEPVASGANDAREEDNSEPGSLTGPPERSDRKDAALKNIIAVYGSPEKDNFTPPIATEPRTPAAQEGPSLPSSVRTRSQSQNPPSRRLNEAFNGTKGLSPVAARRDQIGALRRSSGPSPPPGVASQKKTDVPPTASKNGRVARKDAVVGDILADAPPGFETRTAAITKAGFMSRPKADSRGAKAGEGGRAPPQNDRAHAFREAMNTRRHSTSSRSGTSRRTSHSDSADDSGRAGKGNVAAGGKHSFEKDGSRRKPAAKGAGRPTSFPGRRSFGGERAAPVLPRARLEQARVKKDDGFVDLRVGRPAELRAELLGPVQVGGKKVSGAKVGGPATVLGERKTLDPQQVAESKERQLANSVKLPDGFGYTNAVGDRKHAAVRVPFGDRLDGDDKITQPGFGDIHHWSGENNGAEHQAEAFVNDLLSHEDEEYEPAPTPVKTVRMDDTPPGLSMIDIMRQLHATASAQPTWVASDGTEDVVLPPLPNAEEEAQFESYLRRLGWTPVEEDEPKNSHSSGIGSGTRQGSRVMQPELSSTDLRSSLRCEESDNIQRSYYSHFP